MTDRDRVIGTLNAAIDIAFGTNCELAKIPVDIAVHAVDMLKEQRCYKGKGFDGGSWYCGKCGALVKRDSYKVAFCSDCGRKVLWDADL